VNHDGEVKNVLSTVRPWSIQWWRYSVTRTSLAVFTLRSSESGVLLSITMIEGRAFPGPRYIKQGLSCDKVR